MKFQGGDMTFDLLPPATHVLRGALHGMGLLLPAGRIKTVSFL